MHLYVYAYICSSRQLPVQSRLPERVTSSSRLCGLTKTEGLSQCQPENMSPSFAFIRPNLMPETPSPQSQNLKPQTPNPIIQNSKPQTPNPKSKAPNPKPQTPHLKPET